MLTTLCTCALICTLKVQCNVPKPFIREDIMIITHECEKYNISDEDLELIYRCVMSEAGGESDVCQEAVATVILNRFFSPKFPDKISEIIVPGQFSTSDNGAVTSDVIRSVHRAIAEYDTPSMIVPYTCYYFRADYYHDFGIPYFHIDNTYFSLSEEATD